MSVYVNFGTHKTTAADLRALFERVGSVWSVTPVEAGPSGRLLPRAIVRFYAGEFRPGDAPDAPPELPPPAEDEIRAVSAAVDAAIGRFNCSVLNGSPIFVKRADCSPQQLHTQYMATHQGQQQQHPRPDLFPVNPFYEHALQDDDYQQGFMAGFKLGLKDGARGPSKH